MSTLLLLVCESLRFDFLFPDPEAMVVWFAEGFYKQLALRILIRSRSLSGVIACAVLASFVLQCLSSFVSHSLELDSFPQADSARGCSPKCCSGFFWHTGFDLTASYSILQHLFMHTGKPWDVIGDNTVAWQYCTMLQFCRFCVAHRGTCSLLQQTFWVMDRSCFYLFHRPGQVLHVRAGEELHMMVFLHAFIQESRFGGNTVHLYVVGFHLCGYMPNIDPAASCHNSHGLTVLTPFHSCAWYSYFVWAGMSR